MTDIKRNGNGTEQRNGRRPGARSVGWYVREIPGKRMPWQGRVRVPGERREESQCWPRRADAEAWAQRRHAELLTGLAVARESAAGARTAALANGYMADLALRRRAPRTIVRVGWILQQLANRVPDLGDDRAPEQMRAWLADCAHLAARTSNKYLIEAKALAKWAVGERRLARSPFERIGVASVDKKIKEVWTLAELRAMLAHREYGPHMARSPGTPDPWHLVAALLIYSGMRVGEALHLRWQDIDWPAKLLLVRASAGAIKTRTERMVPLQPGLAKILRPIKQDAGPICTVGGANPRRLMAFAARAGVEVGDRSPHSFRHSYAGIMTATGVPGPQLAVWLGHSTVQTTMIYTESAARYLTGVKGWARGEIRL